MRRHQKARSRLAVPDEDLVAKPKHMHDKTFVGLGREYLKAVEEQRILYYKWNKKLSEQFSKRRPRILEEIRRERIEADL